MDEKNITCLNGAFLSATQAMLPVADRGFRFGDGLFETIRLESGVPYQWEAHLARLQAGLVALRFPALNVDWQHFVKEVIRRNSTTQGTIRIAISRGVGSRGYLPEDGITPNWVIEHLPAVPLPTEPYKLHLSSLIRPPLTALPVHHKLAHGIGSTLALMEAHDHGCEEAILLTDEGKICEAAGANLFWITNQKIFTPSLETGCLAGTTRAAVMRLTTVEETVADIGVLHSADAIFITNTRLGIWPASSTKFKISDSTRHPLLLSLNSELTTDRQVYSTANKASWI